jgi:hypothetical protein
MKNKIFVIALVFFISKSGQLYAGEQLSEEKIITQYIAAIRDMEKFYSHIHATGNLVKIFHKPAGDLRDEVKFEFWSTGVNHLSTEINTTKSGELREWVEGSNSQYRFTIVRSNVGQPFTIQEFVPASSVASSPTAKYAASWNPDASYATGYPAAAYSAFDVPMSRIIESPSFKIRQVAQEKIGGDELIRIDFDFKPDRDYSLVKASVLVQPNLGWAVRSYEGGFGENGKIKRSGTVDYQTTPDGAYLPKKIVRDHPSYHYEFIFDDFIRIPPESKSAKTFRLSNFGLPEVGDEPVEGSWGNLLNWIIVLGLIFLIIAMFFAVMNRRARAN